MTANEYIARVAGYPNEKPFRGRGPQNTSTMVFHECMNIFKRQNYENVSTLLMHFVESYELYHRPQPVAMNYCKLKLFNESTLLP